MYLEKKLACSKRSLSVIVLITIIINRQVLVCTRSGDSCLICVSPIPLLPLPLYLLLSFPYCSALVFLFSSAHCWVQCLVPVEDYRGHCKPSVPPFRLHVGSWWLEMRFMAGTESTFPSSSASQPHCHVHRLLSLDESGT